MPKDLGAGRLYRGRRAKRCENRLNANLDVLEAHGPLRLKESPHFAQDCSTCLCCECCIGQLIDWMVAVIKGEAED